MKKEKRAQKINIYKSIQDLEKKDWGEPNYRSHLVTTIHQLRRKPLIDYSIEDLRIMIGQNIGLPFLIPLAIEQLQQNPLIDGDFYSGDLLTAVLKVDGAFWNKNPALYQIVEEIIIKAIAMIDGSSSESTIERRSIEEALYIFKQARQG